MEKKDTRAGPNDESFDFHLDPNRVRTNAEIQLFADVFKKGDGVEKGLGSGGLKVNFDDVVLANATLEQMVFEKLEKQKALAASTNAADDLDEVVVLGVDELLQQSVALDGHRSYSVLYNMDLSIKSKAERLHHKDEADGMGEWPEISLLRDFAFKTGVYGREHRNG